MSNEQLPWIVAEGAEHEPANVGYGGANRAFVTMPDQTMAFAKWSEVPEIVRSLQKEIAVYQFLADHQYPYAPELKYASPDGSSLAVEVLSPDAGWDWHSNWDEDRLSATLAAMDSLAALTESAEATDIFNYVPDEGVDDSWQLVPEHKYYAGLAERMRKIGKDIQDIPFDMLASEAAAFVPRRDSLVHYDVRADNCPWNAGTKEVRLIDWDWVHVADPRIDRAGMLINIAKTNPDLVLAHGDQLDRSALLSMVNYWFKQAATPIYKGGDDTLRDKQLASALTGYELAQSLGYVA